MTTLNALVLSNANLLSSILRNLVHNAVKYPPAGGRVSVGCFVRGHILRIEVNDTGVGIAPEHLTEIFAPFRRLDASSGSGLGLGLFISQRAANLLNHSIEVESDVGQGSKFSLVADLAETSACCTSGRWL